jgi:uncharacterized protein YceK
MRRITIILLICAFIAGCSQVQLSPPYRQTLEISSVNVAELNKRCQAGDNEACKEGLAKASKTLDLLLDAAYGRSAE